MRIIHARRDDWVPSNPRIHPASWLAAFALAVAMYVVTAIAIGHLLNGNGAPFLS